MHRSSTPFSAPRLTRLTGVGGKREGFSALVFSLDVRAVLFLGRKEKNESYFVWKGYTRQRWRTKRVEQ